MVLMSADTSYPFLMHQHGTFIRSIRTNDGWSRGTDATDVCVGQGSDVGLGQGNSMGVGQGKGIGRGKGLGVARLPQANTIREPPTTAAVRADKRAKRESDGVEVERSHETGRKQQDSFGTHTHGRACFMKRPFWSDCMSPCCNHPCACAIILCMCSVSRLPLLFSLFSRLSSSLFSLR